MVYLRQLAWYDTPDEQRRREYLRGMKNLSNPIVREWLERKKRSLTPVELVQAMATFCERPVWSGLAFYLRDFIDCHPKMFNQFYGWNGFGKDLWDTHFVLSDAEFNRLLSPWIGPPPTVSNEQIGWILRNQTRSEPPTVIIQEMVKLTEFPLSRFHIRSGLLWINPSIDRSVQVQAEKWNAVRPRWGRGDRSLTSNSTSC